MSWTDERVALLKKLWGEGRTAAEIAKDLGGVTRNAVIGKAHRLKLSSRISPIQQNTKKVVLKTSSEANNNVSRSSKVTHISPVEVLEKKLKTVTRARPEKLYSLMDLKPRACRWPEGDPKEDDFGFCGAESLAGLPYCQEHAQLAYQAATRNRILKDKALLDEQAEKYAKESAG
ncbi:MAG: GcrA family cell cycle regulator [Alphaproteobacteria bacterium]|nr:GcrA family cell cycle regulator [Alphaproteobacteria bacterium]